MGLISIVIIQARLLVTTAANIICVVAAACMAYLPRHEVWSRLVSFWLVNCQSVGFVSESPCSGIRFPQFQHSPGCELRDDLVQYGGVHAPGKPSFRTISHRCLFLNVCRRLLPVFYCTSKPCFCTYTKSDPLSTAYCFGNVAGPFVYVHQLHASHVDASLHPGCTQILFRFSLRPFDMYFI